MRWDLGNKLLELVVHLVLRLFGFLALYDGRPDHSMRRQFVTQPVSVFRILRDALRQDVQGSFDRLIQGVDVLLEVHELLRASFDILGSRLFPDVLGERLQPALDREPGFAFPFWLERKVNVLEAALGEGGQNLLLEFVGQLALFFDRGQDRLPPFVEFLVILALLVDIADLDLVEIPGDLFAITRDERNSRSLFEQVEGRFHTCGRSTDFFADSLKYFRVKHDEISIISQINGAVATESRRSYPPIGPTRKKNPSVRDSVWCFQRRAVHA